MFFLQIDNFFIKAFSGVFRPGFDKPFHAPVVGFLHLFREKASGQFAPGAVVGHALAADAPLRARSIGTGAVFYIVVLVALSHTKEPRMKRRDYWYSYNG